MMVRVIAGGNISKVRIGCGHIFSINKNLGGDAHSTGPDSRGVSCAVDV
jgi:hypothetical protein